MIYSKICLNIYWNKYYYLNILNYYLEFNNIVYVKNLDILINIIYLFKLYIIVNYWNIYIINFKHLEIN